MAHSVEGRFPFLDHRVVEYCNQLAPRRKLPFLDEKQLLKRAAADLLPAKIRERPSSPIGLRSTRASSRTANRWTGWPR